ncbi:MAG: toxin-antitoxin system YwqK family antitoxin [Bacteroidetes bacterium]|nr:MAG: toxin-antitoxin system YwqK family antitoxin [Bacteroidota bacterium]
MRLPSLTLLLSFPLLLSAQIEKVYDDLEQLVAVNPINVEGYLDGVGVNFHANGAIATETPFVNGKIEGEEREYYEDGRLKSVCPYRNNLREGVFTGYFPDGGVRIRQEWSQGQRHGNTFIYYPDGSIRAYGKWEYDEMVFAQRFSETGMLLEERLDYMRIPLDTAVMGEVKVVFPEGKGLKKGHSTDLQVFVPLVPTAFLSFSTQDGAVGLGESEAFPLALLPGRDVTELKLYVQIRTHSDAGPSLLKSVVLPVAH